MGAACPQQARLTALAIHYKDYAVWQAHEWAAGRYRPAAEYWKNRFAELPPPLELPTDRIRPAIKQSRGAEVVELCGAAAWDEIKRRGRHEGVSPFMALMAVLQLLLARHSRADRFVIGTPVAGRDLPELEPQVGFYVNLLPILAEVDRERTFREHLAHVRDTVAAALSHAAYPFDRLVEDLALSRDPSRTPLFDVLMVFQSNRTAELRLGDVAVVPQERPTHTSQYDLTFDFAETTEGLRLRIEYDVALFDAGRIARMARQLHAGLREAFAEPAQRVKTLTLCPADELEQLRSFERGPRFGTRCEVSIPQLVAAAGALTPGHPAILMGRRTVSYRELQKRTAAVAASVRRAGVPRQGIVAVAGLRSEDFIVAMLGVMRAGCVYLPLELKHPDERLRLVLEDGNVRHAIAIGADAHARLAGLGLGLVPVGDGTPESGDECPVVESAEIAYVIYTSGSTGRPKGVEISHGAFATMITAQTQAFGIERTDRCAWWASCAFDASVSEIFLGLVTGATVVVAEEPEREDPEQFLAWLRTRGVTVATLPPAFLRVLNRVSLAPLRVLVTAGEAADPGDARHYAQQLQYFNAYGPTETAVCATVQHVGAGSLREDTARVPIGKPLAVASIYLLDGERKRVPIGVPGEVFIGGRIVGQGYRNAPALTAERFLPDPFAEDPKAEISALKGALAHRMYRTGDLARWREDGTLEFLGREDHQVKIRGFRIELGEIEAAIRAVATVRDAAVHSVERQGGAVLVAYVVAEASAVDAIRAHVAARLPDYMRPAAYVCLGRLPMNSSGKLDKAALPPPSFEEAGTLAPPRTEREQALAAGWRECLGVERVGRASDFFALGGESIKALRLVATLRARGWSLALKSVFSHPQLAGQAEQLTAVRSVGTRVVEGTVELFPIQKWFLENHRDSPLHHFNQAVFYRAADQVDERRLAEAVRAVWQRHAALRAVFALSTEGWRQHVRPATAPAPELALLEVTTEPATAAEREAAWVRELQTAFDLSNGPLVRYGLIRGAGVTKVLCITHHLVSDWVSHRILLEDLNTAYASAANGAAAALQPVATELDEWTAAARSWASDRTARRDSVEAWRTLVASMPAPASAVSPGRYGGVTVLSRALTVAETAHLVADVAAVRGATVRDALVAAIARAEQQVTGKSEVALQLEGHGRDALGGELDVSRTVGWFTSLYPFLAKNVPGEDGSAALGRIRDHLATLPDAGVSHGRLRAYAPDAGVPAAPTRIGVNYLGEFLAGGQATMFQMDDELPRDAIASDFERDHPVDVSAWIFDQRLNVQVAFVPTQTPAAEMTRWLDGVMTFLADLRQETKG